MATQTLNPNADAHIRAENATTNYGTATPINIGEHNAATAKYRMLIKFDLSSISTIAKISSATLRLYATVDASANARTYRVYRLKRAWVEGEVTWNIFSTGNNWQTAGASGANDRESSEIGSREFAASEAVNAYKEFSLTAAKIEEMTNGTFANNGFLIQADTEDADMYSFNSREAGSNLPELVVVYTIAGRQFQAVLVGL